MKILIATGNDLLSEGLSQLLMKRMKNNGAIGPVNTSKDSSYNEWIKNDVILTDYPTLCKVPKDCSVRCKIILLDSGLEKETIVSTFLTDSISGIINSNANSDMLLKAIQVVHEGEIWIDNPTLKNVLAMKQNGKMKELSKLTERENAIAKLVAEGYRNKEIAGLLSISEQTVKAHLNRIFRKSNVSSRTELIATRNKNF